ALWEAEDGIRGRHVTGVQTCALPISDTEKIFGDFFGVGEIGVIEERLIGVEHDREKIAEALKDVDISHYLGRITREELLDLIVRSEERRVGSERGARATRPQYRPRSW